MKVSNSLVPNDILRLVQSLFVLPVNAVFQAAGDASVDNVGKNISDGSLYLLRDSVFNIVVWVVNFVVSVTFILFAIAVAVGVKSCSAACFNGFAFTVSTNVLRSLLEVPICTAALIEALIECFALLLDIPGSCVKLSGECEGSSLVNVSCSFLVVLEATVGDLSSVGGN